MSAKLTPKDPILVAGFRSLKTGRDVAALLEVSYSQLTYYLYRKPLVSSYREFSLIKKNGGKRLISAPISPLKIIQGKLSYILQRVYIPKSCVHGFIMDRSILTNAQTHVRRGCILNIDIKDFFPAINFGRVRGMFMAAPYKIPDKAATVLAQICCFNGHLPQGAPSSPIVSNMVCGKLDSDLLRLSRRFRCDYTRYADDITFSTTRNKLPSPIGKIINDDSSTIAEIGDALRSTIESNGFQINPTKTRIQGKTVRQEVTGLVVNKVPNVRREYVRQIRAAIHAINKFGMGAAESVFQSRFYSKQIRPEKHPPSLGTVLDGRLSYLKMVKGEANTVFRRLFNQYKTALGTHPPYVLDPLKDVLPALWILESEDPCAQGSAFFVKHFGLVTCQHVLRPGTKAFQYLNFHEKYDIEVIGENKTLDTAILKLPSDHYPALELADPASMKHGDRLILAGFPNYREGDTPYITEGRIAGFRTISTIKRILINTPIVAGNSGGPVFDPQGRVIGIAATGADRIEEAPLTEHHGVIPITVIHELLK